MSERNKNLKKIIKRVLIMAIAVPVVITHLYIWFFVVASYVVKDSVTKDAIKIPYPEVLMRNLKNARLYGVSVTDTSESNVIEFVADSVLKEMINDESNERDMIVYFKAEGCAPCEEAYPAFKKFAKKNQGEYTFATHHTPVGDDGRWTNNFPVKINGYPTLVRYKNMKESVNITGIYDIIDYMSKL